MTVKLLSRAIPLVLATSIWGCNGQALVEGDAGTGRTRQSSGDAAVDAGSLDGGAASAAVDAALESDAAPQIELVDETGLWNLTVELPTAVLLSVHGSSAKDVWVVGADDGLGPVVFHWNGQSWRRELTLLTDVDLWWVHVLEDGNVVMVGSRGTVLKYEYGELRSMNPPSTSADRAWGVWGRSLDDLYVVGRTSGTGGFLWHHADGEWKALPLPEGVPKEADGTLAGLFKVWGSSDRDDVWIVGSRGTVLRGTADSGFHARKRYTNSQLIGVVGWEDRVWTLGGGANGIALEWVGDEEPHSVGPTGAPTLQGVVLDDQTAWVAGRGGALYQRSGEQWRAIDTGLDVYPETIHSLWRDPKGGIWAVGGNAFSTLDAGILMNRCERQSACPTSLY